MGQTNMGLMSAKRPVQRPSYTGMPPMSAGYGTIGAQDGQAGHTSWMPPIQLPGMMGGLQGGTGAAKWQPPMQAGYGQIGPQDGQGGGFQGGGFAGGGMGGQIHPIQQAANMMLQNGVHPSMVSPILAAHGLGNPNPPVGPPQQMF